MGCNCGGGRVTAPAAPGTRVVYVHERPDGTRQEYLTPGEAYAAKSVSGGEVKTETR